MFEGVDYLLVVESTTTIVFVFDTGDGRYGDRWKREEG